MPPKKSHSVGGGAELALAPGWRKRGAAVALVLAVAAAAWSPQSLSGLRQAGTRAAQAALLLLYLDAAATDRARGFFPAGCRWRDVLTTTTPKFWDVRDYEYWDGAAKRWTAEQPAACRLKAPPAPRGWVGANSSLTSFRCEPQYCVYQNLWYNQGRYYLLHDDDAAVGSIGMSRDVEAVPLAVRDAAAFASQVDARVVPGDTLLIDFLFFLHPMAIGHWHEHLAPLVSVLRLEPSFASPPDRILLLHLKRTHIFEWVRAVLAAAVGTRPGSPNLPPVYFQGEVPSVWSQIGTELEGVPASAWLCLERVLVVKDVHTGGGRVALAQEDMRAYRRRAYELYGLAPPKGSEAGERPAAAVLPRPPRVITFHRKSGNRRVVNEGAMLRLLRQFGQVRVVEFTCATPFAEQLRVMSTTGVLVSVHTSALANAVFLPPGSAVVELIHRNWVWWNLDTSFKVQTEAAGDVHHFAWRARRAEHSVYIDSRDQQRFGGEEWAAENCDTDECVEAHTKVDVVVDLGELEALLEGRLPLVWAGAAVAEAALPWPGWAV